MDGTFTMPDATTPLTKELKKEKKKLDKLYSPFLMKFFGPTGVLVKAFDKIMTDTVMVQLIQLIRIVDALYSKATGQWKKDEKDKRVVRVEVQPIGYEIVQKVLDKRRAYLDEKLKGFKDEDKKFLREALESLYGAMKDD